MNQLNTLEELNQIISGDLVIVIAKTRNCSVCVPVAQRLELLLKEYPTVPLYEMYVDDLEEVRGQYLLFTVPTVLAFSNGKEILRESRFVEFKNIERLLQIYTS